MTKEEILTALERLRPEIPWAHHFDLGFGVETITPHANEQFYRKAVGLNKLADVVTGIVRDHTRAGAIKGQRVLDLACAEGAHSIALAKLGAQVLGIEGRSLYVERARFVAEALGVSCVDFRQADVRSVNAKECGAFDVVLCSGILHHLGPESFGGFLRNLYTLASDTLILYTHVSTPEAVKLFRLSGPVTVENGYRGYLFREHADNSSKQEREEQVRASLDNVQSFWAEPDTLLRALTDVGFRSIYEIRKPHIFQGYEKMVFRPILVARK
jgi:SAM-dependent methyltransferase